MERKLLLREDVGAGFKHIFYTMIHPVNGFDQIKWEKKGSIVACAAILLVFFLTNVFEQVLTGFIFNTYNPDRISVPSIFLITKKSSSYSAMTKRYHGIPGSSIQCQSGFCPISVLVNWRKTLRL